MRVRNRPNAAEMLAAHPEIVISEPTKMAWKNGKNYLAMINQSILRSAWEKDSLLLNGQSSSRNQLYWDRNASKCRLLL